jgi:hypothetical protein
MVNHIGIDGSKLGTNPGSHSTHCMRDIPECIDGGYIILEPKVNGAFTFDLKYRFDSAGNDMMLSILKTTTKVNNLIVDVSGYDLGNGYLGVSTMVLVDETPTKGPTKSPTKKVSSPTTAPATNAPTSTPKAIEIVVSGGSFTFPYFIFKEGLSGTTIDISKYEMIPGRAYKFVNGGISASHPFFISDNGRRTQASFTITSKGTYLTGIPNADNLEFTLPATFKGALTYYCVPHTTMTNTFKVGVPPTVPNRLLRGSSY